MTKKLKPRRQNVVQPSENKFNFYEFFAGAGMARLGLEPSWRCIWANDNDPRKLAIYEHNYGKGHIDPRDVGLVAHQVAVGEVTTPDGVPEFPLGADMAWASFPCQDLSLAGWQRGMSAGRSGAYWPFWEIMYALQQQGNRPPVIVIENVKGLLYGESFRGLCESLAALGMRFGAVLADAKPFVPQSRPRVFVIAVDSHIDLDELVVDQAPDNPWFPAAVKEAYNGLPRALQKLWTWWDVGPTNNGSPTITSLFEEAPSDVKYHTKEQTRRLLSLMTQRHLDKVEAAKAAGGLQVGFLYKRTRNGHQRAEVRFDGIAGCLRTPKGGSSRQTVVVVRDGRVRTRLLSRIEAARLMGIALDAKGRLPDSSCPFFPPGFSYNDSYLAMGDGVAVPVVAHLASTILNELAARAIATGRIAEVDKAKPGERADTKNPFLKTVDQHIAAWSASGQ